MKDNRTNRWHWLGWLLLCLLIGVMLFFLFRRLNQPQIEGKLYPIYTPQPQLTKPAFTGEPIPVTFVDLQTNLANYQNQLIEVSGIYAPLPAIICRHPTGPQPRWALTSEEVRLNVVGLESLLQIVPAGTPMRVAGILRHYQGALGCGKEPTNGSVWYLESQRIIAPNPLPNFGVVDAGNSVPPPQLPTIAPNSTVEIPVATIIPTTLISPTPQPPTIPSPIITPTPLIGGGESTPIPSPTSIINLPTIPFPTFTATTVSIPSAGTMTVTPTPRPNITPTASITPRLPSPTPAGNGTATPTANSTPAQPSATSNATDPTFTPTNLPTFTPPASFTPITTATPGPIPPTLTPNAYPTHYP